MALLNINHVFLSYENGADKVNALEGIHLDVSDKEFIMIVGPSGCGKSSLLKLIAGVESPTKGEIRFRDQVITGPDVKRGMIFQDPTLFPWLTVRGNVEFGLKMSGLEKEKRMELVSKYLQWMGLMAFGEYWPWQLSGGMKQRVSLARTLINNPDILLMDEPFGALDALTRRKMQELLFKIWFDSNKSILFVTHDVEEAVKLGTRIIVMSPIPGKIIEDIPIEANRDRGCFSNEISADVQPVLEHIYHLLIQHG